MNAALDELADHRRRASAVTWLLGCCDREEVSDEALREAAGIIGDELESIRQLATKIYRGESR